MPSVWSNGIPLPASSATAVTSGVGTMPGFAQSTGVQSTIGPASSGSGAWPPPVIEEGFPPEPPLAVDPLTLGCPLCMPAPDGPGGCCAGIAEPPVPAPGLLGIMAGFCVCGCSLEQAATRHRQIVA